MLKKKKKILCIYPSTVGLGLIYVCTLCKTNNRYWLAKGINGTTNSLLCTKICQVFCTFCLKKLRTPIVPRKWDFSYGTSSCITYFKLRKHLILIK